MIKKVTFTGIDSMTNSFRVKEISEKYKFVEWGVLVSHSQTGINNRFPELGIIKEIIFDPEIKKSMHLCGKLVRDLLLGKAVIETDFLVNYATHFDRVQINTHGSPHNWKAKGLLNQITNYPGMEFIFQGDNVNDEALDYVWSNNANCSVLFDLSHGAGVLPEEWPEMIPGLKCGYAGGIGPDNVEEQFDIINKISGIHETWIDMETKIRTDDDWLDLDKVEKVCEIVNNKITH